MGTTTRAGIAWLGMLVGLAWPLSAQETAEAGRSMAVTIETMAATLHDHADRWRDAAILYEAAAGLRSPDDARAQKDLFVAAQLYLATGGHVEGPADRNGVRETPNMPKACHRQAPDVVYTIQTTSI